MKYTITIEDVAAAELVKICQMLTNEVTVTPKADVIPMPKFTNLTAETPASAEIPTDQWKHSGNPLPPEDRALAETYNALKSPEHAAAGSFNEIDCNGLPWDERIHAGTKAKNKDGSWKQRRGVHEALIVAVETELRHTPSTNPDALFNRTPLPPVVAPAAPIPPAPPAPPAFDAAAAVGQPAAPQAPAVNFGTLTQRITVGFSTSKIDATYPPTICARVGAQFGVQVNTLTDMMNSPEMIIFADALITSDNLGF